MGGRPVGRLRKRWIDSENECLRKNKGLDVGQARCIRMNDRGL